MCVCIVLLLFASCCLAGIAYTDNSNTTHRCVHPLALSAHYFFISNTFVQRTDLTYSYIHKLPTLSVSYLALHSKWVVKCLLHTFAFLLCHSLSLYCCFLLDANFFAGSVLYKAADSFYILLSFVWKFKFLSICYLLFFCCCFRKFFSDCNFSQPFHLCLHLFYYIFISFLILLLALLRQTFTSIEFSFEFYFCTLSFIICFVLLISWVRLTAIKYFFLLFFYFYLIQNITFEFTTVLSKKCREWQFSKFCIFI